MTDMLKDVGKTNGELGYEPIYNFGNYYLGWRKTTDGGRYRVCGPSGAMVVDTI